MNKSAFTVLLSYVLWGLLPVFWKLLSHVDSIYTLFSRIFWSLIVSLIAVILAGKWKQAVEALKNGAIRRRLFACGVLISINWGAFIWCVAHNRVLDCSLAYYINPIIAIVVGFVAFREKMTVLQWISVALAVVGVSYPAFADGQIPVLALVMAGCFAIYGAIKKKVNLPGDVTTFIETLFVTPVALTVIIYMEAQGTGALVSGQLGGWQVLLLPAAGLVTYIPLVLYSHGIRETSMSLSGIMMYVNPTLQFLVGVILYKEELSQTMLVTFGFVIVAVILFLVSGRRSVKQAKKLEVGGI